MLLSIGDTEGIHGRTVSGRFSHEDDRSRPNTQLDFGSRLVVEIRY